MIGETDFLRFESHFGVTERNQRVSLRTTFCAFAMIITSRLPGNGGQAYETLPRHWKNSLSSGEGLSGEANRSLRAKGREEGQIPEICISGDEVIGSKVAARERNHLLQKQASSRGADQLLDSFRAYSGRFLASRVCWLLEVFGG